MEGKNLLRMLKNMDGNQTHTLCIPVGNPVVCFLRPVATHKKYQNKNDVKYLTNWRNQNPNSFLTEFTATEKTTSAWLSNVVQLKDNKILFMLDDLNRQAFGYVGLDYINWHQHHGEADAIVKGREVGKGIMKESIRTMFSWAKDQLGLKIIDVRVLSDNPALAFYHKVGFAEFQRLPLRRKELADKVSWEEDKTMPDSERHLVYLRLKED